MGNLSVLRASAGSGKTYRLVYEYVKAVVDAPEEYRHILAVTFTNKATEELKERVLKNIDQLAKSRGDYLPKLVKELSLSPEQVQARAARAMSLILHDYSHLGVYTIDSFFQRIIRSFIRELNLDLDYSLELGGDTLLARAVDQMIESISADAALREWMAGYLGEKIEQNRPWGVRKQLIELGKEIFSEGIAMQSAAAITKEELLAVMNPATEWAGKTKKEVAAAANKALKIISEAGLTAADFKGGKNSFASVFRKARTGNYPEIKQSAKNALDSDESWASKEKEADIKPLIPLLRPLLEKICDPDERRFATTLSILKGNYRNFALLSDLSASVADISSEQGVMHISRTRDLLKGLIAGNDTPFIFEKAGNSWSRYMIDEFQDTSRSQWENFIPLIHNALSQTDGQGALIVGDVKQSIYRWRGGDWRIFAQDAEKEFNVRFEDLDTNYRTRSNIVTFNNCLFEWVRKRDSAEMDQRLAEAALRRDISDECRRELGGMVEEAYSGHAQYPAMQGTGGFITVTFLDRFKNPEEKDPVITRIEELQERGYRPGDIAVLVRTKPHADEIAAALLDYKARHPESPYSYNVVTAEALTIGRSDAVQAVIAAFRLACDPGDGVSLAVVNRRRGVPVDEPLGAQDRVFFEGVGSMLPLEAFEKVASRFKLGEKPEETAYIQALHGQIAGFSASDPGDLGRFIEWWEEKGRNRSLYIPSGPGAITIQTIHKAKGLEYPAVIVPRCNWRLGPKPSSVVWAHSSEPPFDKLPPLPIDFTEEMSQSALAEDYFRETVFSHVDNLNLLYVALTRAKDELHLMFPKWEGKEGDKVESGRVSELLFGALSIAGGEVSVREAPGEALADSSQAADSENQQVRKGPGPERMHGKLQDRVIMFGEPVPGPMSGRSAGKDSGSKGVEGTVKAVPEREDAPEAFRIEFTTRSELPDLRLSLPASRYVEQDAPLTPRDLGVMLHKAFEQAATPGDIRRRIALLSADGELSIVEQQALEVALDKAMADPVVAGWFDQSWERVLNEGSILLPGTQGTRRPDRVMIRGRAAVAVDYKFGAARPEYKKQMREYLGLLTEMGYQATGYLWYVSQGIIEVVG